MARTFQFQQPVVDFVAKLQDTATETVSTVLGSISETVPALPIDGASDMVGTAAEFVDAGYAMADELLTSNRKFVAGLFGQVTSFIAGITAADEAAKPAAKPAAKKTAAKAA